MSFLELPLDSQIELLLNLSSKELSRYCRSSHEINQICQSDEFLFNLITRKYGLNPQELPGMTLREKYQYLINYLHEVATADITIKREYDYINPYGIMNQWLHGHFVDYSKSFDEILRNVIKTGNPRLVNLVLNELIQRIPPEELHRYDFNLISAFTEALKLGNSQIIQLLLPYYNSTKRPRQGDEVDYSQSLLSGMLVDAIKEGNLDIIKRMLMYTKVIPTHVLYAEQQPRPSPEIIDLLERSL